LQLGYFRIVCRFFESLKFREEDIAFVQNSGKNIDPTEVDMILYKQSSSYYRHQQEILSHLGFEPFNSQHQLILLKEAKRLAHLQVKPANILDSCIVYLRERRIEIPSYSSMRNIIHTALSEYESDLEQTLEKHLRQEDKVLLDELLSKPETFQRYELTFLKRIPQSMRPSVIKYRVSLFERFKAMMFRLNPLIKKLNLSDATIRYYAEYVLGNR